MKITLKNVKLKMSLSLVTRCSTKLTVTVSLNSIQVTVVINPGGASDVIEEEIEAVGKENTSIGTRIVSAGSNEKKKVRSIH